jgi:2-hydroxyglutaryl-CoA dehydratase, D-component
MSATTDRIDSLLKDPLAMLRAGSGATGFVGADIPIEVLLATGRPFGHLPWRIEGNTPWADQRLESSFPFWARSVLEDWHAGRFDQLAQVVFSRSEDAAQRLYYYVRELQRRGALKGPQPVIFDIALIPRAVSLSRTAESILQLATELRVDASRLPQAIAKANALRQRLLQLQQARSSDGAFHERLARAVLFTDASTWIDSLEVPAGRDGGRVLLAGSMPPDERLHRAVESAGATIVAEAHVHGLSRLGSPVTLNTDNAAMALAQQLTSNSISPRSFIDRAEWIVSQSRAAKANAVVLWLTREEEALGWHVPAQRKALEAAGIPALLLTSRRWQADDGAPEAIAQFVTEQCR